MSLGPRCAGVSPAVAGVPRPRPRGAARRGTPLRAGWTPALLLLICSLANAQQITINQGEPIVSRNGFVVVFGTTDAALGTPIVVNIGTMPRNAVVERNGLWRVVWPVVLEPGNYVVTVRIGNSIATQDLVVEGETRLPRRPLFPVAPEQAPPPERLQPEDYQEFTDRWRVVPPSYELIVPSRGRWDPYNRNILKGDEPWIGKDIFLSLTGVSDTLVEFRNVPTPSGVSAERPDSKEFFGEGDQFFLNQNLILTLDLFKGDTVFRPIDRRLRATMVANLNALDVRETGVVNPDVRRGSDREDGQFSFQELFFEEKLADLSANFDFLSVRIGIQPFQSDFRGFIFSDTNLGVRFFGNFDNNRYQYNLAFFERLEKDTNSGLNIIDERRHQQVLIANVYRQDFFFLGYTAQASVHHLQDDATFKFDTNGFLVRPDPIGSFTPHAVTATYIGWAGLGKINRINVDHGFYYVFGRDTLNPIAGPQFFPDLDEDEDERREDVPEVREDVDIEAYMAALEISYDRDWLRPRIAYFYASGDRDPTDRDAEGFDSIFDNVQFAGGGFSFWNRLGIRLAGTSVGLVQRGSLLPDLHSSKEEGQPNFVNPGIHLASIGLDVELTQKLRTIFTANYLSFDKEGPLRLVLFSDGIDREIGTDVSLGFRYRPYLNNNVILLIGGAVFIPGNGFQDIYEDDDLLYQGFTNLTLTF